MLKAPALNTTLDPSFIGPAEISIVGNEMIKITHAVGPNNNEAVILDLYEGTCDTTIVDNDLFSVDIVEDLFSYTIQVDPTKVDPTASNLVTCTLGDVSDCFAGKIEFCAEITVTSDSDETYHQFTSFDWSFTSTDNVFTTDGVDKQDIGYLSETLTICQCEEFECITPKAILQEERVVSACIQAPLLDSGEDSGLDITNFDVLISAGSLQDGNYLEYNPVQFGSDGWTKDALTSVQTQDSTGTIMFRTPVIAQFYLMRNAAVSVAGNALFNHPFDSEKTIRGDFDMSVVIFEPEEDVEDKLPAVPEISVCQCEEFECISFPPKIRMGENLSLCINAFTFDGSLPKIRNFSLKMFAGTLGDFEYVDYNPVWFSADGYDSDSFTQIQARNSGNSIMIQTPVIDQFFIQGHNFVDVTGNLFIDELFQMFDFEIIFGIESAEQSCLQQLIAIFTLR